MAIMIPQEAREYKEASLEGVMFEALKLLPDNYYVVHSFKNVHVKEDTLYEHEIDFLVFAPQKGILCIEAKAGAVKYENGCWKYQSGKIMKHGGPYNQANNNMWDLFHTIEESHLRDILKRCKLLHAVWFPSVKKEDLSGKHFPTEFDKRITLTEEALYNPTKYIEEIFGLEVPSKTKTDLSEFDVKLLLRDIICPSFNVFPSSNFDIDLTKVVFHRLLKEQEMLLNYLVEQKTAVINGAAGTGKTMIAVEKAMRHAAAGEKVLFLCYNVLLKDFLKEKYKHDNIEYQTIAGLSCKICSSSVPDYKAAGEKILDMYYSNTFPYKHVIVDEGQDFGKEDIEEADILDVIYQAVTDKDDIDGTFYVFYDKLQLINSSTIPTYISEADCKLTLYKNCRNTENIAVTSLKPVSERNPKLIEGAVKGKLASLHFCVDNDAVHNKVESLIKQYEENGIFDIVILTCKTEGNSSLSGYVSNGKFKKKQFTTCRKFKGLEADAIILIDIDENTFTDDNVMLYYVGASRARISLDLVTKMTDEESAFVLENRLNFKKAIKNAKKQLAIELNAMPVIR